MENTSHLFENLSEQDNIQYWNEFYRKVKLTEESTFCSFVQEIIRDKKMTVLDIGCGSGRDSFSFAKNGHDVIGLDRSIESINWNNTLKDKAKEKELNVYFFTIDISDEEALSQLFISIRENLQFKNQKIIVYLRFLLHSINESTERILLKVLSKYLSKGDYIAAEFRTIEDKKIDKHYNDHYRRFIVAEELLNDLIYKYGFNKVYFHKGTGLSIFKDEDPYLARIIMKKK
jgi:SAM-dependent methyltransferase